MQMYGNVEGVSLVTVHCLGCSSQPECVVMNSEISCYMAPLKFVEAFSYGIRRFKTAP